jgi:hypothetical protein
MHIIAKDIPSLDEKTIERFISKINKRSPLECWEWSRGKDKWGYGQFKIGFKQHKSHRVAYFLHHGRISNTKCICHKCDNPACCNPRHLWEGTDADNVFDRDAKNRRIAARGEKHGRRKLTDIAVKKIRDLCALGNMKQSVIGSIFGVSQAVISGIHLRKIWSHVK